MRTSEIVSEKLIAFSLHPTVGWNRNLRVKHSVPLFCEAMSGTLPRPERVLAHFAGPEADNRTLGYQDIIVRGGF